MSETESSNFQNLFTNILTL